MANTGIGPQSTGLVGPTLIAFSAAVVIGGINPIAIHFSNQELRPLAGAAIRFAGAAIVFWGCVVFRRLRLPTGSGLGGAIGFGALIAGANALAYWAILEVSPAVVAVFLAAVPLFTMFLAAAHGLETVKARGVAGGLLAVIGIAVLQSPELGEAVPLRPLLAVVGSTVLTAEAGILVKKYPAHHPAATNGVAMSTGAAVLFASAAAFGDTLSIPSRPETWLALGHLALLGTVGMFALYLFVLNRWPASTTSYATVLMPVVTVVLGVALLEQTFSPGMGVASLLVFAGVYIGALRRARVPVPTSPEQEALARGCSFT